MDYRKRGLFMLTAFSLLLSCYCTCGASMFSFAIETETATQTPTGMPSNTPTPTATEEPTSTPTPTPMDPPGLLVPEDEARFGYNSVPPLFEWEQSSNAAYYVIQISASETFDINASASFYTEATSLDLGFFIPRGAWSNIAITLYWRVAYVDAQDNTSDYSPSRVLYKTDIIPPEPLKPADDARYGAPSVPAVLSWSQGVGSIANYMVQVSIDEDFASESSGTLIAMENWLDLATVIDQQTWDALKLKLYWRVCAIDFQARPSPWSHANYFYKSTLPSPNLLMPSNAYRFGAREEPMTRLQWGEVDGAQSYMVEFARDERFKHPLGSIIVSGTELDFTPYFDLNSWYIFHGRYYWRVCAIDNDWLYGPYSSAWEFSKNRWQRYAAYGDSITMGYGVEYYEMGCFCGYPPLLLAELREHYGSQVQIVLWGLGGAKSKDGYDTAELLLKNDFVSHILILFGINDIVDSGNCDPPFECRTVEHLNNIIKLARSYKAQPYVGQLIPVNPEGGQAIHQDNVDAMNRQIRVLATLSDTPCADLNTPFWEAASDISIFFKDWGHPNDMGYAIMTIGWLSVLAP